MGNWWIKGKLSKDDRKLLSHPPYCWVYTSEPEDNEEGVVRESFDAVEYEEPWRYLLLASKLWDLLGSDKGKELWRMIQEEIKIKTNIILEIYPREEDPENAIHEQYVVDQGKIGRMLALLEGLDKALLDLTDEHHRIKPEKLEYVLENAPSLVDSWLEEGKVQVYTLVNSLSQAEGAEWFLKHALRLGRDIYWDND